MGDFNAIINSGKKIGGVDNFEQSGEDFLCCLNDCNLNELKKYGCEYTWTNNQFGEARIWRKLDRALVNLEWLDLFGDSDYTALSAGVSDHSPLIVTINRTTNKGAKPFNYSEIKEVKIQLKELNLSRFSDLSIKVKSWKILLEDTQMNLQKDPINEELLLEERDISIHYRKLLFTEEKFLKQKSRINWINLRDNNNKFFYNSVKVRRSRNKITKLYTADGNLLSTQSEISEAMVEYYKNLVGVPAINRRHLNPKIIDCGLKLDDGNIDSLITPISPAEVKAAMFSIHGEKRLVLMINATSLSIIPKTASPNSLNDYRPIACCNALMKFITKVITNRLSKCVGSISNHCQCAFIPSRRIIDNVLLAHELFPRKFIHWIMLCVKTPAYSVAINGSLYGYFKGGRGLRQGDPLSPILFVLVMDYLSRYMVFISRSCMKESLVHFQEVSGLNVNNDKSSIFFYNIPNQTKKLILNVMGFIEGHLPVKYLGMPLVARRLTKADICTLIGARSSFFLKLLSKKLRKSAGVFSGEVMLMAESLEVFPGK
ncbi:uncharacterized protein LOC126656890 [Mercurialis annua]|uniref:uncharacterized protein LOC126656890 n=1 Tax=Mercurialis annua TaxID=3986 RepID=UPI00215E6F2B|nr:uncharacterized protein LOC126656890 [Mercurialis annua]